MSSDCFTRLSQLMLKAFQTTSAFVDILHNSHYVIHLNHQIKNQIG